MSSGYDHQNSRAPIVFRLGRHLLVILPLHASDAPVGTRPPQRTRSVLLISKGSLSSHHFASSIDGSSAPCFNSTLFGDTMAAAWVQENARWDVFPSSQFNKLNSPKRNTLETAFAFFKLPLNFFDQRRKSKRHVPGKTQGEPPPGRP
jgi:hypothetical protein